QLARMDSSCRACGDCCDFEAFGHKLYITTPELMYFQHLVGGPVKSMTTGVCPYRIDGKCTVYPYRFSGCRIFSCKGNAEKENALCEQAISKFKTVCDKHRIPYNYVYLQAGLEMVSSAPDFKMKNSKSPRPWDAVLGPTQLDIFCSPSERVAVVHEELV
ncbi:MAG: YkgJ family cysteine cluster protein, partial [Planctomycetota bacterium]